MNGCSFWRARIESTSADLADPALADHLEMCTSCATFARDVEGLRTAAVTLTREIEPPRDLWPEIASRIEAIGPQREPAPRAPARTWRQPVWIALAAAMLMVVGGILSRWLLPVPVVGPGTVPTTASVTARGTLALASAPSIAEAISEYRRARQALLAAAASGPVSLPASLVDELEHNLTIVDSAIVELEAALTEDPANHQLQNLLLAQYRQELDLLDRLRPGDA